MLKIVQFPMLYTNIIHKKIHLRKLSEHSVATAFATNVFPVPGGPYNRIPRNEVNLKALVKQG
jgi:hypothetical protein